MGERAVILFLVFMALILAQCYRDEAVRELGRRNMCAKLSQTMEEYEACANPRIGDHKN